MCPRFCSPGSLHIWQVQLVRAGGRGQAGIQVTSQWKGQTPTAQEDGEGV